MTFISEQKKNNALSELKKEMKNKKMEEKDDFDEKNEKDSEKIIQGVTDLAYFFKDGNSDAYAKIKNKEYWEIWPISTRSKNFKLWLFRQGRKILGKAPSEAVIKEAINILESDAIFSGVRHDLFNRVGYIKRDNEIWIDMTNESWQAIKVTGQGWELIKEPPILFKQFQHQLPQIKPDKNGDIRLLDSFLNLKNEKNKILIYVFIVTAFIPNIPHPCLILHGPQGSSKTTFFKIIRLLCDPSQLEVTDFSSNKKELIQTLDHNWMCLFDNVRTIKNDVSDLLCKVITGAGFSQRMLYSDDTDVIRKIKRIIGLNGINLTATQPDLLQRSIIIELDIIRGKRRRDEDELWQELDYLRSGIIGGVLNTLSKAMKIKSQIKIENKPRMADFAIWGEAISQSLGYASGYFLKVYEENRHEINLQGIDEDLVASAIALFVELQISDGTTWEDSPSGLLEKLTKIAVDNKIITNEKDRLWPKQANLLSKHVNRIKPLLLTKNINIQIGGRSGGERKIIIENKNSKITDITDKDVDPIEFEKAMNAFNNDSNDSKNSNSEFMPNTEHIPFN